MAHFFVITHGSKIHAHVAHFYFSIYIHFVLNFVTAK